MHRAAAIILIVSTIYHIIHLVVRRRDRLFLKAMLPQSKDIADLIQVFAYNLGFTRIEPRFAKFNYAEKVEYWAFIWGTVVMTVSGFLLWFNNFTLIEFPATNLGTVCRRMRSKNQSPPTSATSRWRRLIAKRHFRLAVPDPASVIVHFRDSRHLRKRLWSLPVMRVRHLIGWQTVG